MMQSIEDIRQELYRLIEDMSLENLCDEDIIKKSVELDFLIVEDIKTKTDKNQKI